MEQWASHALRQTGVPGPARYAKNLNSDLRNYFSWRRRGWDRDNLDTPPSSPQNHHRASWRSEHPKRVNKSPPGTVTAKRTHLAGMLRLPSDMRIGPPKTVSIRPAPTLRVRYVTLKQALFEPGRGSPQKKFAEL